MEKDANLEEKVEQIEDEHETLPHHLKRLFLYCSLFPFGYEFRKDEMVQLWMAEGFIRERQRESMEDTATEHFNSLVKEGFFVFSRCDFDSVLIADDPCNFIYQVNPSKHSILEEIISSGDYFKAVDGKLDGASQMTRLEEIISSGYYFKAVDGKLDGASQMTRHSSGYYFKAVDGKLDGASQMTRHLSLIGENIDAFRILQNFKHLRTLHILSCCGSSMKHVPHDLCFTLMFLKTLNLSGTLISELPSSIGNVKSLQYIDASYTQITRLPESIDSLHHLQTIKLRGCIHFVQLPKGMKKLSSLRHIDLDIIRQLDSMPGHLGNLTKLQTLPAFLVGRDHGCRVGELKNLNDLKGSFNISRLENVSSKEEAQEAALIEKKRIHRLELRWSDMSVGCAQQEDILECLQPHSSLKELQIQQYSGSILPTWISNPSFADLVVITLYRCRNCKLMPCLGQLPALKSLSIIEVNEVKEIDHQFFRKGQAYLAFPKLERLEVDIMLSLRQWKDVQVGDLRSLVTLTLDSCPDLVTLPALSLVKSLKYLELRCCPNLMKLPTGGLPTSLEFFLLLNCLELKEWCLKSEHWSMLCHVPSIWFDHEEVKVTITPDIASRRLNRAVIKRLVDLYRKSKLGNRLPAYDGRKSLYTAGPLPFSSQDFKIMLIDDDDGSSSQRKEKEREFKVVIKFAARADLHHLELFLMGKQAEAPQEALQVLDIVLRELPTASYFPVGRSFYSPELGRRQSLGQGLESWRGFYQSIRPTQMGLSLNIDMSSTAFVEPLPIIEFVNQLLDRDISSRPLSDADRVKIKKALRGIKVEVTHRGHMRRKYRITGLTSQPTRDLTFPLDERGTIKHVVDYFHETYGFIIKHTELPCLQVGNQQRSNYLPMEVCKIVEGQRYSRRLNERQITALLWYSCQRPHEMERDIIQTVRQNAYHNPYAQEFGIKISENLTLLEARILPAPRLKYHDTGREKDCLPKVGQWNMMNKKMVNGGTVKNWMCINFSRSVQDAVAHQFCSELAQMCNVSGMAFNTEPVLPLVTAHPGHVERVLYSQYHYAMTKLQPHGQELELLIAILPDNNGSLYGDLKRICETDLDLVSQCCLTKYMFRTNKQQYLANVTLKINVKVGGRNTVLVDALSRRIPLVSDRPTIIFGADVTHPHPGEDSSPSIAAVVASQDWPEVTKYAGLVSAQTHRQELIQDLYKTWQDPAKGTMSGGMIKEHLISFRRSTGQKPQRIIFYRDGVSEGQFYQVLLYELDAIRKACDSLEPDYQPPVTFVVVQKRHHTRLFANNHKKSRSVDRSGNILPGTVVDSKICHPTEFDFYLCSHAGIQGTSRPAHYHVLWDENNFSADGLQTLTNNLCYTYARCTRSVSVVPPAYYAHLAAFRARFYLEPQTSEEGSVASGATTNGRGGGYTGGRRAPMAASSAAVKPLPALMDNVKKVMFYC